MNKKESMRWARFHATTAETNLELAINECPTSEARNKLTGANILLKEALRLLEKDLGVV